jgi:hypothetical protein
VNYTWFAGDFCYRITGGTANMDALRAAGHIQYYDWESADWIDDPDTPTVDVSQSDDDNVLVYGLMNVPAYLGVNCRRVRAYFVVVDTHEDHGYYIDDRTAYSHGECF